MNLGIRAHDMEKLPLEELVKDIADRGFTSVQLALGKSFNELYPQPGSLSPGLARYIGNAFRRQNVDIAVLGCYINLIHPDSSTRRKGLEQFKEHIRYARDFGCSVVGTETGNVNPDIVYTTENFKEEPFQQVVESVRELVEEAERFGVIVGIEAGVNHPVYSPKTLKRLLDEIDSNNLQIIFDPVNLLTIDNYRDQEAIFQEAFELIGNRIAILHVKDFLIEEGALKTVAVGQGLLNYEAVFRMIKPRKPYIQILMESVRDPFIPDSVKYLQGIYNQV